MGESHGGMRKGYHRTAWGDHVHGVTDDALPSQTQELSLSPHPHIMELKGAFLTPLHIAFVLEYVEGETIEVGVPLGSRE